MASYLGSKVQENYVSKIHESLMCMLAFSLGVRLHRLLFVYLKNQLVYLFRYLGAV